MSEYGKRKSIDELDVAKIAEATARAFGIPKGYRRPKPHGVIHHDGLIHIEHVPYSDEGEDEVGEHLVLTLATGQQYKIDYSIGYAQDISFWVKEMSE